MKKPGGEQILERVYGSSLNPASRSEPKNRKILVFSTIHNWLPLPSLKNIIPTTTSNVTWNRDVRGVKSDSSRLLGPHSSIFPSSWRALMLTPDCTIWEVRNLIWMVHPHVPLRRELLCFHLTLAHSLLTISRFITLLYSHLTCTLIPKAECQHILD